MYEGVEVGICVSVLRFLNKHVPVFGVGRNNPMAIWFREGVGGVLYIRGSTSNGIVGEIAIIKACIHRPVESGNQSVDRWVHSVLGDNVLYGGGSYHMPRLGENPITQVTPHSVRNSKPAPQAAATGTERVARIMTPDQIIKGEINPF